MSFIISTYQFTKLLRADTSPCLTLLSSVKQSPQTLIQLSQSIPYLQIPLFPTFPFSFFYISCDCLNHATTIPYCLRHFMTFSATGVGFLSHTPKNNVKIMWLVWNLEHIINGIRLFRMRNFRKFAFYFRDMTSWNSSFHEGMIHCVPIFTPRIRI